MTRPYGWPRTGRYSPRRGAKRLPEKQRQRILRRYPTCTLAIPGICAGVSVECHHVIPAADFDDDDPRIDAEQGIVGVCRECHRWLSARDSAERAARARGGRHLRTPERHPGIVPSLITLRDKRLRAADPPKYPLPRGIRQIKIKIT
ncbi:hypothetical protein [Mycobacterium sp.]|uniref:hypothetical protein n=1 Tax=Mycobacterium sp. TaxID=1785 RepID=UPI003C7920C1